MNSFTALILGLVQGITEFIPISSSGHLVITSRLLQAELPLSLNVFFHVASLLAILIYFRVTLWQMTRSVFNLLKPSSADKVNYLKIGFLAVATIPAVLAALFLEPLVESAAGSLLFVGGGLLFTGTIIIIADQLSLRRKSFSKLGWLGAFLIGLAQALAIFPGVSRSGATISSALFLKIDRKEAAEFSFLMAIPAILGGFIFKLKDIATLDESWLVLVIGFMASFVASYLAIAFFIKLISHTSIKVFGFYCLVLGAGMFLLQLFG